MQVATSRESAGAGAAHWGCRTGRPRWQGRRYLQETLQRAGRATCGGRPAMAQQRLERGLAGPRPTGRQGAL
eukprot:15472300-Alexandrium_andersonii.AAC.1